MHTDDRDPFAPAHPARLSRRHLLQAAGAFGAGGLLATPAFAQAAWPSKSIRFVVPFAPGGSSEIVARSTANELTTLLGQSVYVDNKPGAAGNIAMSEVARADDQHTIILGHIGTLAVNPYIFAKLPYDPNKDFKPVSLLAKVPSLYVVHPDVPVKNLTEFIAYAKARPGKLSYGSAGNGSAGHLAFEYLKMTSEVFMLHVPYRSPDGSRPRPSARRRSCRSSSRARCAASRPARPSAWRNCPTCRPSPSRASRVSR
jgi:tripartite-type tricarboxylate transporter receptor subunit TctC